MKDQNRVQYELDSMASIRLLVGPLIYYAVSGFVHCNVAASRCACFTRLGNCNYITWMMMLPMCSLLCDTKLHFTYLYLYYLYWSLKIILCFFYLIHLMGVLHEATITYLLMSLLSIQAVFQMVREWETSQSMIQQHTAILNRVFFPEKEWNAFIKNKRTRQVLSMQM